MAALPVLHNLHLQLGHTPRGASPQPEGIDLHSMSHGSD